MKPSNIQLLAIINFLHALSHGMSLSGLTRHLMKNGGNHIILGLLIGLLFICKELSKEVTALYERGRRFLILISIYVAILCHTTSLLFSAWYVTFFARVIYALTSRLSICTKELGAILEPEGERIKIYNVLELIRLTGISSGSIIGGYLYQSYKRFEPIGLVSLFLLFIILLLAYRVDSDINFERRKSALFQIPSKCYQRLKNLKVVDFDTQLSYVIIKITSIATFTILNSRFALIIHYNYKVNYITMGYVKSFNYAIIYIASLIAPFITESTSDKKYLCEMSMIFGDLLLVALYYAPHYYCFLIFFLLLMSNYVVITVLLDQDALDLKYVSSVNEAADTIVVLVNILVPVIYGVIFHYFGPRIFKILSLLPSMINFFMLNRRVVYLIRRRFRKRQTRIHRDLTEDSVVT